MDGWKKDLLTKDRVHVTHRFGARVAHSSEADKPAPLVNERFVRGRVNHTPYRGEIIVPALRAYLHRQVSLRNDFSSWH